MQISGYSLVIQARDSGTPPLSSSVTVNVDISDVNDNSPVFTPANYTAVIQVSLSCTSKTSLIFKIQKHLVSLKQLLMIYLPKMYQIILLKGKYKHSFSSYLLSFCLLRLLNFSIHHTFYSISVLHQEMLSGLKNSELG